MSNNKKLVHGAPGDYTAAEAEDIHRTRAALQEAELELRAAE